LTGGAAATVERRTRGILALDKPAGITSFDAVREVRRLFSERRVGHAGTLDPTATGLLPVCVGRATRLVDYFHAQPKTYHCVVRLGERSDTFDTEGTVAAGGDASTIDEDTVRQALQRFVGEISQVPPMHSAVRHEGRHLYELAREGKEVERRPRTVAIYSAELVGFKPGRVAQAEIVVSCGKGAYMRVLAADLGEAVGSGGLLGWLSRTRYGSLDLREAVTLPALAAMADPRDALLPLDVAVAHLPKVDVAPALEQLLRRGQPVWLPRTQAPAGAGECRAHAVSGELIAIGEMSGLLFRPTKVLVG
jgi:tRNA pseudouridine55 synthase